MSQIFGKYILVERLAMGGMAEIWLAQLPGAAGFAKTLVIKRIHPDFSEDEEFVCMFTDEARLAVQLNHANVVQIFDFDRIGDSYYIAMELVEGKDLKRLMMRGRAQKKPLPLDGALQIAIGLLQGLYYAHTREVNGQPLQIVHRDISPHNILISYQGEVKITDFGIARAASRSQLTASGVLKGKIAYMSPEQTKDSRVDQRSDLFAAGIVLWEMLTGERLFRAENELAALDKVRGAPILPPHKLNPEIPPSLSEIVLGALEREPEKRYQEAKTFLQRLQEFFYQERGGGLDFDLGEYMRTLFTEEKEEKRAPPGTEDVSSPFAGLSEEAVAVLAAQYKATDESPSPFGAPSAIHLGDIPEELRKTDEVSSPFAGSSWPLYQPSPPQERPTGGGAEQAVEDSALSAPGGFLPAGEREGEPSYREETARVGLSSEGKKQRDPADKEATPLYPRNKAERAASSRKKMWALSFGGTLLGVLLVGGLVFWLSSRNNFLGQVTPVVSRSLQKMKAQEKRKPVLQLRVIPTNAAVYVNGKRVMPQQPIRDLRVGEVLQLKAQLAGGPHLKRTHRVREGRQEVVLRLTKGGAGGTLALKRPASGDGGTVRTSPPLPGQDRRGAVKRRGTRLALARRMTRRRPKRRRRKAGPRQRKRQRTGLLRLTVRPWGRVYLGKKLLKSGDVLQIRLPVGKHRLIIRHDVFGQKQLRVRIRANKEVFKVVRFR